MAAKIPIPDDFRRLDAAGWTAPALAARYGVTTKTIHRWRGRTRPTYLPAAGASYQMSGRPRRSAERTTA